MKPVKKWKVSIIMLFVCGAVHAGESAFKMELPMSCLFNKELQRERSNELQRLLQADQADREGSMQPGFVPGKNMAMNDRKRRKRAAEIFAEGCINSAEDYQAAAYIFQHGEVPDHYYQAYLWTKKAADLDTTHKSGLAALAIDRYLVSIGKKQLYASQAIFDAKKQCYCMAQNQNVFTDEQIKKFALVSKEERYKIIEKLNANKHCSNDCDTPLQDNHKGDLPGIY